MEVNAKQSWLGLPKIVRGFLVVGWFVTTGLLTSCSGGSSLGDIIDSIKDPDRKTIDTSILGTNAFANDGRFGSMSAQFNEIKNTLRLNKVRVLFNWDNNSQPSPGRAINWAFTDALINSIPSGVDVVVVLTGLPSWMANSANWVEGNPRTTFVERWVRPAVTRYKSRASIIAWQVWNEENDVNNPDNTTLGVVTSPSNYVEMVVRANNVISDVAPSDMTINGATTAINQNFSGTIDYNQAMKDAGILQVVDKFAIHYYGEQYENVVRNNGVAEFLNGLNKGVWITESGAQGINNQLAYGERTWPFLKDKVPSIERIYQYQFVEGTDAATTYGLRNLTLGLSISDLYIFLRDRP